MEWVEILYLRSVGSQRKAILTELKKLAASTGQYPDITGIKMYRHAALKSDFTIIVHGKSDELNVNENTLGMHLSYLLKEFGMVDRSLWVEE